ncbi:MAG: beta-propeller fold lactonase family protein [Gammaproteobacteria bacterium]|nr:beta-propeller fold lactonase family protein [Gammaproteobacteria bacterium]
MAHRIRGLFSNARALSYFVVRIAVAILGNGAARRYLESPGWGATESPPSGPFLDVDSKEFELPGCPFDVLPTSDGDCVFVSLHQPGGTQRSPGTIAVLHRDGDTFRLSHQIFLTAAAWGLALVRDETILAVANSHGVALLDAHAARKPERDPIVAIAHYGRDLQTIHVLGSADGRWLYASDEHNRTVSILDLNRALSGDQLSEVLASQVPVDLSPLGMGLSADGKYLYVTCEMSRVDAPDLVNWFVWGATMQSHLHRAGVLSAIDLDVAIEDPENAVVAKPVAGGHPVRLQQSRDGTLAWVTARASNQLIAFSTEQSDSPEQIATTPVGPAPVGLAVLDELGVVLVANSNRFASAGRRETLSVIDMERTLAGQSACLGHIPVGSFPREINVDLRQRLVYITNFDSGSLTVIPIESIEQAVGSARVRMAAHL